MEAKDTVIGKVQRDNIFYRGIGTLEGVCKMQAEITWDIAFKAGEKQAYDKATQMAEESIVKAYKAGKEEESTQVYHAGIHDGILRGRREVVEWLKRTKKVKVPKYQLKEWGIEEAQDD